MRKSASWRATLQMKQCFFSECKRPWSYFRHAKLDLPNVACRLMAWTLNIRLDLNGCVNLHARSWPGSEFECSSPQRRKGNNTKTPNGEWKRKCLLWSPKSFVAIVSSNAYFHSQGKNIFLMAYHGLKPESAVVAICRQLHWCSLLSCCYGRLLCFTFSLHLFLSLCTGNEWKVGLKKHFCLLFTGIWIFDSLWFGNLLLVMVILFIVFSYINRHKSKDHVGSNF